MGFAELPALSGFLVEHWQLLTVAVLTLGAVVLFVTEALEIELVAAGVMAVLLITGIITPKEGLSGFSNPATITIAAMFILSEGLRKTGLVNRLGDVLSEIFADYDFRVATVGMMLMTGLLSGIINNTAVVAIFLPVVLSAARKTGISSTKALMALSFSAMFGGICTLIGTSTNILVSSIIVESPVADMEPIGMFELAPFGLICFAVGIAYMLTVGDRLIPEREAEGDLTESFEMEDYLTEVEIRPLETTAYKPAQRTFIHEDDDVDVLEIEREGESIRPQEDVQLNLEVYDVVRLRGSAEAIQELAEREGIVIKPGAEVTEADITAGEAELFEAVVAPDGMLDGCSLDDIEFAETFAAEILAIRRSGDVIHDDLLEEPLQGGDVLLLQAQHENISQIQKHPAFVVISELGLAPFKSEMVVPAVLTIAGVVATAAFEGLSVGVAGLLALFAAATAATLRLTLGEDVAGSYGTVAVAGLIPLGLAYPLDIVVTAVTGAVLMNLMGIVRPQDSYDAVNWQVIILLAGLIPLGVALENTGGIELIADGLMSVAQGYSPHVMVAAFYLVTVLLTGIMSNQATAILFAPLAIQAAVDMGLDPRPFVMAVTFAASASFLTPVGYQTNTLIYGAGQFEFKDFLRAGTPLTLLFWALATIFIPIFWPIGG